MFWRIFTAFILVFWAVMTGLRIRDSYYADDSRFAEVPVRMVFDLFLKQAAAFNHTLDIYHHEEKLGHTSFMIQKLNRNKEGVSYALHVNGSVQIPTETVPVQANFNFLVELAEGESWRSFKLEFKAPAMQTEAVISWKQGDVFPDMDVKKNGQMVMNTEIAKSVIGIKESLGGGSDWLLAMLPTGTLPDVKAINLKAREGRMDLAGKQRRCYIVQSPVMPSNQLKMYFSELGELARVDLPHGFRLIEPMMHGLEPRLKTLE
jgi:hypothetical protein